MISFSNALRGALLSVVLMAAAPVAGASAASLPTPAAPALMAQATTIAAGQWGRDACGGQVAITWEHLGRATNAESRWAAPAGGTPDTYLNCRIAFSLDAHWDWPKLCTVVTHELGHLNGHEHSAAGDDVMSPFYFTPISACAPAAKAKAVRTAKTQTARGAKARSAKARTAARARVAR